MTTDFKSLLTDLTHGEKLGKFNRLELLCRPPVDVSYTDILLQLKTYFMVVEPIQISHVYHVIDTASGIIKPYKKECYSSGGGEVDGTHCLSYASQGKSNLFGWHPPEDSTHYDTYVSQPMQKKYRYSIQSIHDLGDQHCVASQHEPVEGYVNMVHDAVMTESFMEYAVQVAAYCHVAIREYYTPGLAPHAVIIATCCFDEESHVIPAKLECITRVHRFLKAMTTLR